MLNDHTLRAIQVASIFAQANQTVTSAQVLLIAAELDQTGGNLQNAIQMAIVNQAYESLAALLAFQAAERSIREPAQERAVA